MANMTDKGELLLVKLMIELLKSVVNSLVKEFKILMVL